jgi:hypothetical protein
MDKKQVLVDLINLQALASVFGFSKLARCFDFEKCKKTPYEITRKQKAQKLRLA